MRSVNTFNRLRNNSIAKMHQQLIDDNSNIQIFMNRKERTQSMANKKGQGLIEDT